MYLRKELNVDITPPEPLLLSTYAHTNCIVVAEARRRWCVVYRLS
jgi:hypothetical protein